jgi:hypothetical protein
MEDKARRHVTEQRSGGPVWAQRGQDDGSGMTESGKNDGSLASSGEEQAFPASQARLEKPSQRAAYYRYRAAFLLSEAERFCDAVTRRDIMAMAEAWRRLAEREEQAGEQDKGP